MKDHLRKNHFIILKLFLVLILEGSSIIKYHERSGVSVLVLLFSACFLAAAIGYDIADGKIKVLFLSFEAVTVIALTFLCADIFALLASFVIMDFISKYRSPSWYWYLSGYLPLFVIEQNDRINQLLLLSFLFVVYFQHGVIIRSYQNQLMENEQTEQKLKGSINKKDTYYKEEMRKNILTAENSILDEKAKLSQVLHDKLGHSINGSLYQLEACKVLLDQDKETCRGMLQAVIDNLRGSMDEIRKILRRERPDKNKLSLMQFQQLCDECRKTGIEASFTTQGNLSAIPEKIMEILLDNTAEAISNAMKYAKCTQIDIKLIILNQLIRCTITDNGVGCREIIDGMGLAGMRRRMRTVNGILDFESEAGFVINMLLPIKNV